MLGQNVERRILQLQRGGRLSAPADTHRIGSVRRATPSRATGRLSGRPTHSSCPRRRDSPGISRLSTCRRKRRTQTPPDGEPAPAGTPAGRRRDLKQIAGPGVASSRRSGAGPSGTSSASNLPPATPAPRPTPATPADESELTVVPSAAVPSAAVLRPLAVGRLHLGQPGAPWTNWWPSTLQTI